MGISERQKMYDHHYEVRAIGQAVANAITARQSAMVNRAFRRVELDAINRLMEAARDVADFIDPYVDIPDKPDLRNHFIQWPSRERLDWETPVIP